MERLPLAHNFDFLLTTVELLHRFGPGRPNDGGRQHAPGMAAIDSGTAAEPFRGRTRQRQWEQLSRGLYVPRASPLSDLLRGWQLVLPASAAFTSLTAAEVSGWWLPEAIPHPVFATVPIGERYPERTGLLVCRHPGRCQLRPSMVAQSRRALKHCSQRHVISVCSI